MLKRQMKDVPADQQDMILKMVEENPKFFEEIAAKVKQKVDAGQDQMTAAMTVMRENQEQIKKMMK